ncbi:MAG: hypothetical protein R2726_04880 [Acidimicrobiales bacterium]
MASIVDHIRRSYRPPTAVLEPEPGGRGFTGEPATPDARTVDGLVVYRFAASLYYANAEWFGEEVLLFVNTTTTTPCAGSASTCPPCPTSTSPAARR